MIRAKGARPQSGEVHADAGLVTSEGNTIFGRAKFNFSSVAGEITGRVSVRQNRAVTFRTVERERHAVRGIELVLIEYGETIWADESAIGDTEFFEVIFRVAEVPTADAE